MRSPFTRYIFSELNGEKIRILKQRLLADQESMDVRFLEGETNANVNQIVDLIPKPTSRERVLTFCLVDPYRLADIRFGTFVTFAKARIVDFLVLIPSGMDASRNQKLYLAGRSDALDKFLGRDDWRKDWISGRGPARFSDFVVEQFGISMRRLGYKYDGLQQAHLMTTTKRRLPIYHLVMFSKSALGVDFWEKCRAAAKLQQPLF